jgi:O-antigen/teichoic acid export membrane protein
MVIFFLVVFVIFALFILWSGPLMLELFYKGKYARQLPLLGIFATIYIFDGLNGIVTYYLKAVGMIQHGVKIRIVLTLLNAIVLIPLIFRFREAGGLLATMFTGIVLFGSYFRVLVKEKLI